MAAPPPEGPAPWATAPAPCPAALLPAADSPPPHEAPAPQATSLASLDEDLRDFEKWLRRAVAADTARAAETQALREELSRLETGVATVHSTVEATATAQGALDRTLTPAVKVLREWVDEYVQKWLGLVSR